MLLNCLENRLRFKCAFPFCDFAPVLSSLPLDVIAPSLTFSEFKYWKDIPWIEKMKTNV